MLKEATARQSELQAALGQSELLRTLKTYMSELNLCWLRSIKKCAEQDICNSQYLLGISKGFVDLVTRSEENFDNIAESRLIYWTTALPENKFVRLLQNPGSLGEMMDLANDEGSELQEMATNWLLSAKMASHYDIAQAAHIYGLTIAMTEALSKATFGTVRALSNSPEMHWKLLVNESYIVNRIENADTRNSAIVVAARLGANCKPPKMAVRYE